MTTVIDEKELDAAIAAAELDDEEKAIVTRMVVEGLATIDEAVAAALKQREPEPTATTTTGDETATGDPTPKQLRDLDKENGRHVEAVQDIMGAFVADFVPCSTCDTMGLEPPQPPAKTHDFFRACATCNGYGQVLTGSLEQQFASIACPDCGGRGYLEMLVDNTPAVELVKQLRAQRATAQVLDPAQPPPAPAPAPALDVGFGRPAWMGDPTVGQ